MNHPLSPYEKIKVIDCDVPRLVLSGPLSRTTAYTLYINGPWRSKEITNLIESLEMQRQWLESDERAEAVSKEAGTPETQAEPAGLKETL